MSTKKNTSIRICKKCGKRFERLISFMKKRNPRFCSVPCARRAQIGKNKKPNGGSPTEKQCEHCKRLFAPRQNGGANRFCSRSCVYEGMRGDNAANWVGGRWLDAYGYAWARMRGHPRAKGSGYVREHHLVVERRIGRFLRPGETVHHINGVRDDNRDENLQLCHGLHGSGVALKCFDCGSANVGHTPLTLNAVP